jgi:GT2 family glycosyltransferase/tetratricopeptide (TPR) repeat protein
MNEYLFEASTELLGLDGANAGWGRSRLTETDSFGYFRELLQINADWIVNIDEDAFVLDPSRLLGLLKTMKEGGYAACGMPDGGVVPIRRHNPAVCNAFFNVFDMSRVRPVWAAWDRVVNARHAPEYEALSPPFSRRSTFAFDHFERYYGSFFSLLAAGERILYLDAEEWTDGVSTLLKDATGTPLMLHCWYTRHWPTSLHTRQRYRAALDYARQAQGLAPAGPPPPPAALTVRQQAPPSAKHVFAIDPQTGLRAERMPDGTPGPPYDCIVCQDELARHRDPGSWLRKARASLLPGGSIIAVLPNARYHAIVSSLMQGRWLGNGTDPGHRPVVRHFTRREIEKLFFRAGFELRKLEAVTGQGYAEWLQQGRPPEVRLGSLRMPVQSPGEAEEYYAPQYRAEAVPAEVRDHGLTSIVILTYNLLEITRLCVNSIHQFTDEPYELIFVDNGSTDGTPDYLASVPGAKLIRNASNRGVPAGVKQGIQASSGRQVLMLNNDTIVTTGWLHRMLNALHADPRIGLVGPCSNNVSGDQQIAVNYDDLAQIDGFAWDWGKAHDRVTQDTDRLVGFCMLASRELIDRIGVLDESFELGCYEDDDYSRRALRAGFRAVIARDAFVHHFGGVTFRASGVDFATLMSRNGRLYREKWRDEDRVERSDTPSGPQAAASGKLEFDVRPCPGGGLLLGCKGIESSLCLICRDNSATIGPCLTSIRDAVDEMVVVDTGSKDDTPEIARHLGARVFHFPWVDSFSAARNESLRHARGKWIFWMDSDDTIDADNARKLRELIHRGADPGVMGFVVSVHCPGRSGEADDMTIVNHVKLFRNYPQLRFDGRIHEQILPAINALGSAAWSDLFVVHSGYDTSPEGQKRKLERDLRLLFMELDERPDHTFTLFNLAMTYADIGRWTDGARCARRSIDHSPSNCAHLRKAYSHLMTCLEHLGRADDAMRACEEGLKTYPLDDELRFRKAGLLQHTGRVDEAIQTYHHLLDVREDAHLSSVVDGIAGHIARLNLSVAYRQLGDLPREEEQLRLIVQEKPRYRMAWRGLGDSLLQQSKYDEARTLADRLLADSGLRAEGRILRSFLAAAQGDQLAAQEELERGTAECPNDAEVWRVLANHFINLNEPPSALAALRKLVELAPRNAAAYYELGVILIQLNRPEEAIELLQCSLLHRPEATHTLTHLGYALKATGRWQEACAAWESILRLEPDNHTARLELQEAQRALAK